MTHGKTRRSDNPLHGRLQGRANTDLIAALQTVVSAGTWEFEERSLRAHCSNRASCLVQILARAFVGIVVVAVVAAVPGSVTAVVIVEIDNC